MRRRFPLLLALLAAAAGGAALAQTTLWVSSTGTKLKADTRATSATVADLPLGAELRVLEARDAWYRVAGPGGAEGWIYRGKVTETPPGAAPAEGGGLLGGLTGRSTIQAASADTSRSIRGLSPETTQYADGAGTPQEHREALDRILALTVSEDELERFLQDGRIGEYAMGR